MTTESMQNLILCKSNNFVAPVLFFTVIFGAFWLYRFVKRQRLVGEVENFIRNENFDNTRQEIEDLHRSASSGRNFIARKKAALPTAETIRLFIRDQTEANTKS